MENSKKYAPGFYRGVSVLCIALLVIGGICFVVGLTGEVDAQIAGGILLGCALLVWMDFVIACQFYNIAIDKGYSQAKYLSMAFILTMVGYLLIIAMPDKNGRGNSAPSADHKATLERIAKLKNQGVLTEIEAAKMRADVISKI